MVLQSPVNPTKKPWKPVPRLQLEELLQATLRLTHSELFWLDLPNKSQTLKV